MAEDIVVEVGLDITPDSIRSIQSDVKSAFRNIAPQIDIDTAQIQRQFQSAISSFTITPQVGAFTVNPRAISQLSEFISRNVEVKFNKVEAAARALAGFKRQVEEQAKVTLEAQAEAGRRQAEAQTPLDTVSVQLALDKAAAETNKLAQLEVQAQIAANEFSRVLLDSSTGLKKLKGAALRVAEVELQGIQSQTDVTAARGQLASALSRGRAVTQADAQAAEALKESAKIQKASTAKLEALSAEHANNQRSLNAALVKQKDQATRASAQDTVTEANRLRAEFNARQRSLNAAVGRNEQETRAAVAEEVGAFAQNVRALRKIAFLREDQSQEIITATQALSKLKNIEFNDLNALGQFAGITLQAERKRLQSIVDADKATQESAAFAKQHNAELLKYSSGLKRLSGNAKIIAQKQLRGIGEQQNLEEARSQLARALLAGRKVAQSELAQIVLNKEVEKAKKERIASEKEVAASNRRQAARLISNIGKNRKIFEQIQERAGGADNGDGGRGASRGAIARAEANRKLKATTLDVAKANRQAANDQRTLNNEWKKGNISVRDMASAITVATKRLALYAIASQFVFGFISAVSQAKDEILALDEQARRLVFFKGGNAFDSAETAAAGLGSTISDVQSNFNGLLQASINTGISLQKTTEILVTVARVGQEVDGAFAKAVTSLVRLEAGALNAETAVTNLNAIQKQFIGTMLQYSDAAEDVASLTENINITQAVLATTASKSAANVQQLSNAVVRVGSALSQIQGINANATIAVLGEAFNVTGANASRLSTSFKQLSTLIVQNAAEIKELSGIEVLAEGGQIKGFESILEVLEKVNTLKGTSAGINLIKQIADRRNLADVQALSGGVTKLRKAFEDFTDPAKEQANAIEALKKSLAADELQANSFAARIEKLKSEFIGLSSTPILGFLGKLTDGFQSILTFAGEISNNFGSLLSSFDEFGSISEIFDELLTIFGRVGKGLIGIGAIALRVISPIQAVFNSLLKAINGAFDGIENFISALANADTDIDIDAEKRRGDEFGRQATLIRARILLEAEQAERQKEVLRLAELEKERLREISNLRREGVRLSAVINDNSTRQETKLKAIAALRRVEKQLIDGGAKSTLTAIAAAKELLALQDKLNEAKRRDLQVSGAIEGIESLLASAAARTRDTTIVIRFDSASLNRELSRIDDELKILEEQRRVAFVAGDSVERVKVQKEIDRLSAESVKKRATVELNTVKIREAQIKTTTEEAKKQAAEFERAGNAVAESFKAVVSAQEKVSDIFTRQSQSVRDIIRTSGEATARLLETTGASIEQRLSSIAETSDAQIAEIQRNRRRQDGGENVGNVRQAVNRVISTIEAVNRSATATLFRDIGNFERDVNVVKLRAAARGAREELDIRIRATERDIQSRRTAIQEEIKVINQRIAAERKLNDIRVSQQRDFGRLLLEAPEKFVETIQNIDLAEQFFKGISSLDIGGLTQISQRSQQARGQGQGELLTRVLRGLQSSAQFGRGDVAEGIGNSQLLSVFERLQNNAPSDLLRTLEQEGQELRRQTLEQQRIRELQQEDRDLSRESVAIQEARIRLAAATAAIAQRQRNETNQTLNRLIDTNAANFILLQKAQSAARATLGIASRGGLSDEERDILKEQREAEKKSIEENTQRRDVARAAVERLTIENTRMADSARKTVESFEVFNRKLNDFGATEAQAQEVAGASSLGPASGTSLDTTPIFREIAQSLRPLRNGRVQIVSPQLESLRKTVADTGGTRDERNELRRLERQARSSVRGGSADTQGREVATRFLRDDESAREIESGFRTLLQDRGGADNRFVAELRKLRGEGSRGASRVDATALRALLGGQGLGGVAGDVSSSRSGAKVIDRLLKLSDELSENQRSVTRAAGQEIKRILSDEVAEGIRDLKNAVQEAREGVKVNKDAAGQEALVNALNNFSIAAPESIARLNSEMKDALHEASIDFAAQIREMGPIFGGFIKTSLEDSSIAIKIPTDDAIGIKLSVDIANGISSDDFARSLARQLENAGLTDKELISKITRQLQIITKPLIERGLITASPDFVTDSGK